MATFEKRGNKWRALIRKKGYPTQSSSFFARDEAEKWARGVEDAMTARTWSPDHVAAPNAMTFKEAADAWWKAEGAGQKGADRQENRLAAWKAYKTGGGLLADFDLRSVKPATFERYIEARRAEGIADPTICNDLNCARSVFTFAQKTLKMRFDNPFAYIDFKQLEPAEKRERRLIGDEATWLIEGARRVSGETGADLVAFTIESPRRRSEFVRLQWRQVDFTNGAILLSAQKNGEKSTWVRLTKVALEILERRSKSEMYSRPFPLSADRVTRAMPKWCAVGRQAWSEAHDGQECPPDFLQGLRYHDLKHEATSALFERGLSRAEVRTITRHKTDSQLDRYTHLDRTLGTREKLGF